MRPLDFAKRQSGLLLHLTSLDGPGHLGDLGQASRRFVDFLERARQSFWQMLPIHPIGQGNSPYSSISAFAGEPLFIDLVDLHKLGLLKKNQIPTTATPFLGRVSYKKAITQRTLALRQAFTASHNRERDGYGEFIAATKSWLPDYCLFAAAMKRYQTATWYRWPKPLRRREPSALNALAREMSEEIDFQTFIQWVWHRQWSALHTYAAKRGVSLVGDIPIFVDYGSADVWAKQEVFFLDADGRPTFVSGVPPDYFNPDGQRWGHALYDWNAMGRERFRWWIDRFRGSLERFDAARLDHFIGFHRFWKIPAPQTSARKGTWELVPGHALLTAVQKALGPIPLIAEDLGTLTPEVGALRDAFRFPGMRILQFGFGNNDKATFHLPFSYPPHSIAYTGTHDNDTCQGWFRSISTKDPRRRPAGFRDKGTVDRIMAFVGGTAKDVHWSMIRAVGQSPAHLVCFPVQDVLGLPGRARMNIPGSSKGNWEWRLKPGQLNARVADKLGLLTESCYRIPSG